MDAWHARAYGVTPDESPAKPSMGSKKKKL